MSEHATPHLRCAVWSGHAGPDPAVDAETIGVALNEAATAGARLLLCCEGALGGYPGAGRSQAADLDGQAVAEAINALEAQARDRHIVVVLGTILPAVEGPGICDSAVVLGCGPRLRYDKRILTPWETSWAVPGRHPVVIGLDGWRLGIAICYELRFPRRWADYRSMDALLCPAHLAGPDPDPPTKTTVLPAICATRSAEWATPLLLANTAHDDRWLDSGAWDGRGRRIASSPAGLLVVDLPHRRLLDPWYGAIRHDQLDDWRDLPDLPGR